MINNKYIKEINHSYVKPDVSDYFDLILNSDKGPINKPIFIGPTISKPKWFQFWRWHLISKYKEECYDSLKKFNNVFGEPEIILQTDVKNKNNRTYSVESMKRNIDSINLVKEESK